jgi:hypothetical protein
MIIFIDVDDTFVRSFGTKRIPIPSVIKEIQELKEKGAILHCWSSGGREYAHASAIEFGLEHCFVDYLPKPDLLIDDQPMQEWRRLRHIYPNQVD